MQETQGASARIIFVEKTSGPKRDLVASEAIVFFPSTADQIDVTSHRLLGLEAAINMTHSACKLGTEQMGHYWPGCGASICCDDQASECVQKKALGGLIIIA